MKLLLDQGLPRSAAALLREAGFDTVHTAEIGMSRAADAEIIEEARRSGRVVVTLDADFHTLMALAGASSPSIIRIRMQRLGAEQVARLIQEVLNRCAQQLQSGALVSVRQGRVSIRRLPVIR